MKIIPKTIIVRLTLISHKRSPLSSGRMKYRISKVIPKINAYHSSKTRETEPKAIRKTPE